MSLPFIIFYWRLALMKSLKYYSRLITFMPLKRRVVKKGKKKKKALAKKPVRKTKKAKKPVKKPAKKVAKKAVKKPAASRHLSRVVSAGKAMFDVEAWRQGRALYGEIKASKDNKKKAA